MCIDVCVVYGAWCGVLHGGASGGAYYPVPRTVWALASSLASLSSRRIVIVYRGIAIVYRRIRIVIVA